MGLIWSFHRFSWDQASLAFKLNCIFSVYSLTCFQLSQICTHSFLPLSATNSAQSVWYAPLLLSVSDLIQYTTMCWQQSLQSMTCKRVWAWKSEKKQWEWEWECGSTIQCFIKTSNTKEHTKGDVTTTKIILGRSRVLGVGWECQKNLI